MSKTAPKKKRVLTRRAFIKGMGGGAAGTALAARFLDKKAAAFPSGQAEAPVYSKKPIRLTVNGQSFSLEVEPRETLLEVLRERLKLTGTKRTCERGECGGCTVLLDGKPVYSCITLAACADGKSVTTIEGLAKGDVLHPVQEAFVEKDSYQCGFCTPGFIMSSVALLEMNPSPSLEEIKASLGGNICRCGNYFKIYEAVARASQLRRRG